MAFDLNRMVRPAAFAALVFGGLTASAHAQGARIGLLECNVSGGTGFVITSSKALDCFYTPRRGAAQEHYMGTIDRFGLDIGMTGPGKLSWAVLATSGYPGPGALQGSYSGVGGGATVGAGATANVLVGGNGSSLSLQPLSLSGQIGLNVTAGIGQMTLEYAPLPEAPAPTKRRHRH